MNRIRQGWDALRRGRRSGVSLSSRSARSPSSIGLLLLSIVYSSSMLLSRANREIGRERCYQLAQSFAQVLDSELTGVQHRAHRPRRRGTMNGRRPRTAPGRSTSDANSVLAGRYGLGAFTMRTDPDAHHLPATAPGSTEDDDYGRSDRFMLREQLHGQRAGPGRTGPVPFAHDDRDEGTGRRPRHWRRPSSDYQVWVSVRAEKGADSFTCTTTDIAAERTAFSRSTPGKGEDGGSGSRQVYWVSGRYFSRSANGKETGRTQGHWRGRGCPQGACGVSYTYDINNPTYSRYEPIHKPAARTTGGAAE